MLSMILVVIVLSSTDFFRDYLAAHPEVWLGLMDFVQSVWFFLLVAIGLGSLALLVWLLRYRRESRIARFFVHIWEGMVSIQHMPQRGKFLFLTAMGFGAQPRAEDPLAVVLTACPFAEADAPDGAVCVPVP